MSFATLAALAPMQPPAAPPSGTAPATGSSCPGGLPQFVCSAASAIAHPLDTAKNAAGAAVSGVASDAFDGMVNKLKDGVGHAVGLMMSYWMHIPIPAIGDTGSAVDRLRQATLYLTILTAVVSIFFVVMKAVFAHHQAASEESMNAATGLVRIIIASSVAIPTVILLSKGGDEYSQWLVDQAANGDVGKAVLKLMAFDTVATGSPGFTFGLALIALFTSLVQAFLIVIRDALLILLVGTLPLAAAASITAAGRQTWNKMIAWLIAFLLFKPVAAMCYAGALWSVTNAHNEIDAIAGIFLVILAVLVLPALMRLITPSVAKVGGGGGGGVLAGAVGGGVATGARAMSGASRSAASAGGGGGGGGGGKARFLGEQGASGSRPTPGGPPRGGPSSQRPSGSPGGGGGGKSPASGAAGGGKVPGGPAVMAVQAGAKVAKGAHQAVTNAANEAVDGGGQQ